MLKVLAVDDSRSVHAYLREIFMELGIEGKHANDGPEALKLLAESGQRFDAVFLDWEMPGWNGLETLRRLREVGVRTPIIMLTSKNDPEDISTALAAGANDYAMKPFVSDVIVSKLEYVTGRTIK